MRRRLVRAVQPRGLVRRRGPRQWRFLPHARLGLRGSAPRAQALAVVLAVRRAAPGHDPDVSTAAWVRDVLPTLPPHRRPRHDCVLGPGEVLYFPPNWWHATLNEDAHTVFVSSFASDQARGPAFLGA